MERHAKWPAHLLHSGAPKWNTRLVHNPQRGLRQGDPLFLTLFILVMDVLNSIVVKALEEGLLQPLSSRSIQHRLSLYADDVVIFLRPAASDIDLMVGILQLFGKASGLKTSIQKSSVSPIQCSSTYMETIQKHIPCQIEGFPLKYLGLPLSLKKLTKFQLQPFIDHLADLLLGWKSELMSRVGRVVQDQFVLTAMVIYHAMALDFPTWDLKAINKICRNYLWRGRKEALRGHCLITWPKVTHPKELRGLGIPDLKNLNGALRLWWLCLRKTEPNKPWASFPF
jgi:hypothetical protein